MILKYFPSKKELSDLTEWYLKNMVFDLKITKETKIASMGSCFAREIKNRLVSCGYNYLQEEADKRPWLKDDGQHPAEHASAAWERVYNVFTFKNIVEYSFGEWFPRPRLLYREEYCVDILRTRIVYPSAAVAEADVRDHIEKSRAVLSGCEVFILTLGLVEVWKYGDVVMGYSPLHYSRFKPAGDFTYHISSYDENRAALFQAIAELRSWNPGVKIVLTVSPVHLCATHREDADVLSASCYSKSVLRAVAGEMVGALKNVFYFPSYEIATMASAMLQRDIWPDSHHVGGEIVDAIMDIFMRKTGANEK